MTNKERWLSATALLISILPFILVAGSMQLLPDYTVLPNLVHGEESVIVLQKYQFLYLGLMGFVPALLVVFARVLKAKHLVERNFLFMVLAAMFLGILFLGVIVYGMIYNIIRYDIDLLMTFGFFSGSVVAVSLVCGELANFFPSLRRNDVLGLKNRYTMADNRVWVKVHYTAADVYMSTLYGFAVFSAALSIWLDFRYGWVHLILWLLTMSGLLVWGRVYSRLQGKLLSHGIAL